MPNIMSVETNRELRSAVLAEYKQALVELKVSENSPAIRYLRCEQPVSIDEAMFVKVVSQATGWSVPQVITTGYAHFTQLTGSAGLFRPEWQLAIRVAQSFSTWHLWSEGAVGLAELAARFNSVNKCILHLPSRVRRRIVVDILSLPNYDDMTNAEIYRDCKLLSDTEVAWKKFESKGCGALDVSRFCRFVRGLRRRRDWLNRQNERSQVTTIRERLDKIRWAIVDCPPNRHEHQLNATERMFASRMYPVGKLVGIEIEFGCKQDSELQEVDSESYPVHPGITWKTDSSVGAFENDGMTVGHRQEVNMLINPEREDEWSKVESTLRWLRSEGGRVNATCGLHVHLDTRHMSHSKYISRAAGLRTMFKAWAKYTVNKRRATNYFCNIEGRDRYSAVNTQCRNEHNTIEIRIGHSTLNVMKVRLWTDFLRWAISAKKSEITSFEGFMSSSCEPVIKAYLLSRIVKFADTWQDEMPVKLKHLLLASSDDICV